MQKRTAITSSFNFVILYSISALVVFASLSLKQSLILGLYSTFSSSLPLLRINTLHDHMFALVSSGRQACSHRDRRGGAAATAHIISSSESPHFHSLFPPHPPTNRVQAVDPKVTLHSQMDKWKISQVVLRKRGPFLPTLLLSLEIESSIPLLRYRMIFLY